MSTLLANLDNVFPPVHDGTTSGLLKNMKQWQFAKIVDAMKGGIIVAAHLGGHVQWDEVEKYLVGKNIYLDTSMGFDYYSREQFLRIVKNHGADKVLFASDAPWSNAQTEIEHLKALPLSESEKRDILGGNAQRLLNID